MSKEKRPWGKFYWNDWRGDPRLKACGYAARGLWIEMLCIMAESDPTGYLTVSGTALEMTSLARLTGGTESEVNSLLDELERNGVFSRNRNGRIYSRRMIKDAKKSGIAQKNGKNGGNPTLRKQKGNAALDNLKDKTHVKPQKPEARYQSKRKNTAASGDPLPSSTMHFEGHVVRLTETDWRAWMAEFSLTEAELERLACERDDFLKNLPESDSRRSRWFMPTRNWLKSEVENLRRSRA
ncbi:MAG TPA: hypothetical protein VHP34_04415 [Alphaproteobacteria bacterium]|nr:hypothetical protein [Alphaproteobacteria bacterium]